jgi:hypothetical protein
MSRSDHGGEPDRGVDAGSGRGGGHTPDQDHDDYMTYRGRPYGRYVGLLGVLIVVLVSINAALTRSTGSVGVEPGHRLPPFAVPLARGEVNGAADVATRANDGAAGRVPACKERGQGILNICELYEQGPVVLALFVDAGSCPQILSDMQTLAPSFPGVRFAGVAIKGGRGELLKLMGEKNLSIPIGFDSEGALAGLYKQVSCPQVSFAYPGGVVQSRALLERPAPATLRARVSELVRSSRARGWRPPPA